MLFLLYFGRKRPWKRDILGKAGYICRMRKKLLVLMAGAASIAGPVQAQFNTVSTVPSRYRVEVVSAGRDNAATLDRKSTRLNSSHTQKSRMPSSA